MSEVEILKAIIANLAGYCFGHLAYTDNNKKYIEIQLDVSPAMAERIIEVTKEVKLSGNYDPI